MIEKNLENDSHSRKQGERLIKITVNTESQNIGTLQCFEENGRFNFWCESRWRLCKSTKKQPEQKKKNSIITRFECRLTFFLKERVEPGKVCLGNYSSRWQLK